MGAVGTTSENTNTYGNESWRKDDPKYQEKTLGGVYFWSNPNSIWGNVIDRKMYEKLPKYIQKSVISLDNHSTLDGNHASIYYVDTKGVIQWFDEYGLGDFYSELKHADKSEYGDVNDFVYTGSYNLGDTLERKKK